MDEIRKKDLEILLRLVDEPDTHSWETIREKIISFGLESVPVLEEFWDNSFDPFVQSRLEEMIQHMQHQHVYMELTNWVHFGSQDLLSGALLLTRFLYAETNTDHFTRIIGNIVQDVWLEMNNTMTGLDKIKVINHLLYDVHGFKVLRSTEPGKADHSFTAFIERKKGHPLSMAMLYIIISQGLKMPVFGVELPGQLILAYTFDSVSNEPAEERKAVFYINPAQEGLVFQRGEIERFLSEAGLPVEKTSYYSPSSNVNVVKLLAKAYIFDLQVRNEHQKVEQLEELIRSLF